MNPHLLVLTGPLQGQTFNLSDGELTVGRGESNKIYLNDRLVSRNHAIIESRGGPLTLIDLDSSNGTFVNGLPIARHPLEHGDEIRVGGTLLLCALHEEEARAESVVVDSDPKTVVGQAAFQLYPQDCIYLAPTQERLPPAAMDRLAGDLKALLNICTEINSARTLESLQEKLLETTFKAVPADDGAILLFDDQAETPSSTFTLSRRKKSGRSLEVSRNLVRKVLNDRVGLLSHPSTDFDVASQPTLIRRRVESVLCAPLFALDRIIGVIYFESTALGFRFDDGHLQFVLAVAGMAGLPLDNVRQLEWLQTENRRLKSDFNLDHAMVGESQRMKEVYRFVAKVALSNSTVLIRGESGTGKELVARAVHSNSPRCDRPFVAINCAALTETLLESELFGHEKGAFTGAITQKRGKLEVADGGTLFLDEVGELAPGIQAKLLRALQERQFERVGGTRAITVNIRLVAATNRDLERAISEGTFRQDLYYRLNVVSVTMPALKERREDIPLLARYFVSQSSKKCGRMVRAISPDVRQCLMNYDWPGNVRELENVIERAVVLGTTEMILAEDLPETILEKSPLRGLQGTEYHRGVRDAKRQLILNAINQARGNYTQAAKLLGLHPNNLHRLIRDLDLKSSLKKEDEAQEENGV